MQNFTAYPEPIFKLAHEIHTSLVESSFYKEECEVEIIETETIEFICSKIFDEYIDSHILNLSDERFGALLRDIMGFVVYSSLKRKGLVDSIENDGKEIIFLTKDGKAAAAMKSQAA